MKSLSLITLILFSQSALANDCVCKGANESIFKNSSCPFVSNENFIGDEIPRLHFQSIPVKDLMGLMGDFATRNVCVRSNISQNISVKIGEMPWNKAVHEIAKNNGLKAATNQSYIYIYD